MRTSTMTAGAAVAIAIASAGVASAAPPAPSVKLIDAALIAQIRAAVTTEVVSLSIRNQNHRHRGMDAGGTMQLDATWVAERDAPKKPLITATLANPLSSYLTRVQAHSGGLFVEIMVVDEHGLNVGQSSITSDFWQGDEDKYQRTFPLGPTAVFIDEPEFDDESGTWRVQVSISVPDVEAPAKAIGAASFDVNLSELDRRAAL